MSKPKAKRPEFIDPESGPVFSARFLLTLVLAVVGIAWIVYYYAVVRVDPIKGGSAKNYTFGLNYYPNFNIRLMLDWSIVDNDEYAKPKKLYGAIAGDAFSVLQFRVQYAF